MKDTSDATGSLGRTGGQGRNACAAGCGHKTVADNELTCGAEDCLQIIYPGSSDSDYLKSDARPLHED
jgi:hypothetical protein